MKTILCVPENYAKLYDRERPGIVAQRFVDFGSVPAGWVLVTDSIRDEVRTIREKWVQKTVKEDPKMKKKKGEKK